MLMYVLVLTDTTIDREILQGWRLVRNSKLQFRMCICADEHCPWLSVWQDLNGEMIYQPRGAILYQGCQSWEKPTGRWIPRWGVSWLLAGSSGSVWVWGWTPPTRYNEMQRMADKLRNNRDSHWLALVKYSSLKLNIATGHKSRMEWWLVNHTHCVM